MLSYQKFWSFSKVSLVNSACMTFIRLLGCVPDSALKCISVPYHSVRLVCRKCNVQIYQTFENFISHRVCSPRTSQKSHSRPNRVSHRFGIPHLRTTNKKSPNFHFPSTFYWTISGQALPWLMGDGSIFGTFTKFTFFCEFEIKKVIDLIDLPILLPCQAPFALFFSVANTLYFVQESYLLTRVRYAARTQAGQS